MDYLEYYDLTAEPFQNQPDPRFYYESQGQRSARLRLLRGLEQRRGLAVVLGESGCGKSTLAANLSSSLPREQYQVHVRVTPHGSCAQGWLLPEVARALGTFEQTGDPARTLDLIQQALLLRRTSGVHWVLMVDEAQMLASAEVMHEFRSLLNLASGGQPLLSIVLLGLQELRDALALDPSLAQRVEIRVELPPMGEDDTAGYLAHRLGCVGGSLELFASEAVDALRSFSRGIPRLLNTLADTSLFEGFLAQARPVPLDAVLAAADQLDLLAGAAPGPAGDAARAAAAAAVNAVVPPSGSPAPPPRAPAQASPGSGAEAAPAAAAPASTPARGLDAAEAAPVLSATSDPEALDSEPPFAADAMLLEPEPAPAEAPAADAPAPGPTPRPPIVVAPAARPTVAPTRVAAKAVQAAPEPDSEFLLDEPEPEIEIEIEPQELGALDPIDFEEAVEESMETLAPEPAEDDPFDDAPARVSPRATAAPPEAIETEEPLGADDDAEEDALFDSLIQRGAASEEEPATAPEDEDDLIDMADFLTEEPSEPPAPAEAAQADDEGDLEDLFEQIQLED